MNQDPYKKVAMDLKARVQIFVNKLKEHNANPSDETFEKLYSEKEGLMNNIEQYGPPIMSSEENDPLSRTLNAPPPSPLFMHSPNKGVIADFQYPPSYFVSETPRTPTQQGIRGAQQYPPFGRAADLTGVPLEGALQLVQSTQKRTRKRGRSNNGGRLASPTKKSKQTRLTNFFNPKKRSRTTQNNNNNRYPTQYNTQGRPI